MWEVVGKQTDSVQCDLFYTDLRKEFPSRTLTPMLCPSLHRTEHFSGGGGEKGNKVPGKGEKEGCPAKGANKQEWKKTRETRSDTV